MPDGVSLDQLRTFMLLLMKAAFRLHPRKLRRALSVVSDLVSSLEVQMDDLG